MDKLDYQEAVAAQLHGAAAILAAASRSATTTNGKRSGVVTPLGFVIGGLADAVSNLADIVEAEQ